MIHKLKNQYKQGKEFISFSLFKFAGQGMEMLTPLLIATLVTPDFFGKYSLAKMIIFFFSSFFIASSSTPFIVYANKEKKVHGKINKSFSIQFTVIAIAIILFLTTIALFSEQLKDFANISTLELFVLFPAFIGIAIKLFGENIFLALNKKLIHSLVGLVFGFSVLFFSILSITFYEGSLAYLFLPHFISGLVIFLFLKRYLPIEKLGPFKLHKENTKKFMIFTGWQAIGLTAVYFINWGDNLVLRYFVSVEEIGVYNLGYQIFKGLITTSFIISSYFMPFVIKNIHNKEKMRKYLYKKRPVILFSGLLVLIFFYFLVSPIFKIFYGPEYLNSILILKILIIPTILHLFIVFYLPILNSLEKYKFIQIVNILAVILNVSLNIILVKKFGIFGAAISTTTVYASMFFAYLVYINKLKLT